MLGAGKGSLVAQFIGEAILMAAMAMLIAIIMMSLALPAFNGLVQKNLLLGFDKPFHWAALLLLTLICGLLAGSYPSLYLSSFNPVFVLKGIRAKAGSAVFIRKGLVVLQFTVSVLLIIGTIVIYQQIRHVKDRDLGFNKAQLVQLNLRGDMLRHFQAIRQELINTGSVADVALADHPTIADGNNTTDITWQGKDPNSRIVISQRLVSPEFMSTLGMHITAGRDFKPEDIVEMGDNGKPKDSASIYRVMITASLERLLGKGSAVGKMMGYSSNFGNLHLLVTGVVKDYVYGNIYSRESPPVVFYCIPQATSLMYVRTFPRVDPGKALAEMEAVMKKINPGYPFEYSFVDDQFNARFKGEMLISTLSRVFAFLAIFISCLGLFGLAAYTAERRTKEIGIRKVLGASGGGIVRLLSKDFLLLVFIACAIAFPAAWIIMNNWLQSYPYRVDITGWPFIMGGFLAVGIALLTVSFQAIKAALANPVKSLRME